MNLSETARIILADFDAFTKPVSIHELYHYHNGEISEPDILNAINEINSKCGNIIGLIVRPLSIDSDESCYYYKKR